MPNIQNVSSPVTLISAARSGTSLLHRMIAVHPEFAGAGETASVVFGPWYAVEWPRGIVRPTKEDDRELSIDEKATRVVHSTFLTLFRDGKPRWIHKPIGEPEMLRLVAQKRGADAALEWYWHVMSHAFSDGWFITILRNPFDVVLSQMDKFGSKSGQQLGGNEERIWKGIGRMATILTHPNSLISHAVVYSDLIAEPEATLTELFAEIDAPFHPRSMKPLERIHAPATGREEIDPKGTSRSSDWHRLNPDFVTPDIERAIARLWHKFDARFEIPEHFAARGIQFLDTDGSRTASPVSTQAYQLD